MINEKLLIKKPDKKTTKIYRQFLSHRQMNDLIQAIDFNNKNQFT